MTLDTACSSGLTALVRAIVDLRAGLCDTALVASANLILDRRMHDALRASGFLSKTGRCSAFRDLADGYVRSEGVFAILLRPLDHARRDGSRVDAVIRRAIESHCGRSASLTAPSARAQADLLARTWGANYAEKVGFIETHGTGTRLGDPIETDGLKTAMRALAPDRTRPVYLGALKANAGHMESSAGLAGLIKAVGVVGTGRIPPNITDGNPNPLVDLDDSPFRFPLTEVSCPTVDGCPRVAGISSFGFGGSSVHVLIEQATRPALVESNPSRPCLFVLSARTTAAVIHSARSLSRWIAERTQVPLDAVARTLALHRTHFAHRAAIVATEPEDLCARLDSLRAEELRPTTRASGMTNHATTTAQSLSRTDDPAIWAETFLGGASVDFNLLFTASTQTPLRLPGYAFDRTQLFKVAGKTLTPPATLASGHERQSARPLRMTARDNGFSVDAADLVPLLDYHKVDSQGVLPGVAGLLAVVEAARRWRPGTEEMPSIRAACWPMVTAACDLSAGLRISFPAPHDDVLPFTVEASGESRFFGQIVSGAAAPNIAHAEIEALRRSGGALPSSQTIDAEALYRQFAEQGIDYGGPFRCLRQAHWAGTLCLATLQRCDAGWPGLVGLIDGAFQSGLVLSMDDRRGPLMPFTLGACVWHGAAAETGTFHALALKSSQFRTQTVLCDHAFKPIATFTDLGIKPKSATILSRKAP